MPKPTRQIDLALSRRYGGPVAGVDEAGRGPWAGPIVASAVIFYKLPPKGINDSKQLLPPVREVLFAEIMSTAHVGVGIVSVPIIDSINIFQAAMLAMSQAVQALPVKPACAVIDGNHCPELEIPAEAIAAGDTLSVSIAAASIIAKVTRDRLMCELAADWPVYAFDRNKGYGTRFHASALEEHGVCLHHRRSFRPVWERCRWQGLEDTG
jgi:ribonuclease HII